ncbi:hypothetical protein SXCC_03602 [Gluconacetobacter sp. SXCC-1]|nr:hypothetical protein SXCC_03602 [Gluconacetobacter sp. SXCC-1]
MPYQSGLYIDEYRWFPDIAPGRVPTLFGLEGRNVCRICTVMTCNSVTDSRFHHAILYCGLHPCLRFVFNFRIHEKIRNEQ